MGAELLIREESKHDHHKSRSSSDIDLIMSPKDNALVAVAQEHGVHVCWVCFEQFVELSPAHKLRPVEFNCGGEGTRIMIHSKCAKAASNRVLKQSGDTGEVFWDMVKSHQWRRRLTRLTNPFKKLGS